MHRFTFLFQLKTRSISRRDKRRARNYLVTSTTAIKTTANEFHGIGQIFQLMIDLGRTRHVQTLLQITRQVLQSRRGRIHFSQQMIGRLRTNRHEWEHPLERTSKSHIRSLVNQLKKSIEIGLEMNGGQLKPMGFRSDLFEFVSTLTETCLEIFHCLMMMTQLALTQIASIASQMHLKCFHQLMDLHQTIVLSSADLLKTLFPEQSWRSEWRRRKTYVEFFFIVIQSMVIVSIVEGSKFQVGITGEQTERSRQCGFLLSY